MKRLASLILVAVLAQPALAKPSGYAFNAKTGDRVVFETTKGSFTVVLYPKAAPQAVSNFEKLVKQGFYNGLTFHRVVSGVIVQGGDPKGNGTGGPGWTIPDEKNQLRHVPGAIAMARFARPNSAGSQFYISMDFLPSLDGKDTVFGQVVKGSEVLAKLQATERNRVPVKGSPDRMLKVYISKK